MVKYLLIALLFMGCAATVNKKDERELRKAEKAAIAAEKRLSKIRMERIRLEAELESGEE